MSELKNKMDKKEILDGLYEIKNWKCGGDAKMHAVIEAAIKALETQFEVPSVQLEPCEDAVSRKDVLDGAVTHYSVSGANIGYRNAVPVEYIESLPSVTPKRKTGKWIVHYECPKCGEITKDFTECCPFCGADMR